MSKPSDYYNKSSELYTLYVFSKKGKGKTMYEKEYDLITVASSKAKEVKLKHIKFIRECQE